MPDYPSILSGVVLWVDGRSQAYSDTAGTVPASPFAGRVRRINQASPASGAVQSPSDPTRPYRVPAALNFQVGGAHSMTAPIASSCAQSDVTIALNFTMLDNFPGGPQYLLCNGPLQVMTFSNNVITVQHDGGVNWFIAPAGSPTSYALAPIGSRVSLTVRTSPTGFKASVVINGGTRTDYDLAYSIASTTLPGANWKFGWDGSTAGCEHHGTCSQAIVVSRAVSDAENDALVAWLLANPTTAFTNTEVPLVAVTGDSIARGLGLENNRSLIWSFIAQQSLNDTQPVNLINAALSGSTIANQRAVFTSLIGPFYSALRSRNVLVMAIGTNNLATLGQDGPTALAEYYSYADLALAAGWRIAACTILPRSGTGHDGTFDTARALFNSRLRTEWAARGYHALADVAAIPEMGDDGDDANTTYYQDAIHPTFAGNVLLAPVYQAAMQVALAATPGGARLAAPAINPFLRTQSYRG